MSAVSLDLAIMYADFNNMARSPTRKRTSRPPLLPVSARTKSYRGQGLCKPSVGYKPAAVKSLDEYAQLDAEDESLARWKASLGILPGASTSPAVGPKVCTALRVIATHDFNLSTGTCRSPW